MNPTKQYSPRRRVQLGLTLVELMVGLTLGLFLTSALLLLFANASSNGQNLSRSGMQIESGRYVSELLQDDLRLAGFYGETSVTGAAFSTPDPCLEVPVGWSGVPLTFPTPIQGYRSTDALGCLPDRKAGTDAIALRRVALTTVDPGTIGAANKQTYVQYAFCVDDLALPGLIFSKSSAAFTLRDRACAAPNLVRAYVPRIYYVATCNRCAPSDNVPTLKRVDLVDEVLVVTALAEGVEHLRFEYGFDTDNDGTVDSYLTTLDAGWAPAKWANVMAVKAHFISRSLDKAVGGAAALGQQVAQGGVAGVGQQFQLGALDPISTEPDGYSRRAYSSAVRLVNPSSAREN